MDPNFRPEPLDLLIEFCRRHGFRLREKPRAALPGNIVWIDEGDPGQTLTHFVEALINNECPVIVGTTRNVDREIKNKMAESFHSQPTLETGLFGCLSSGTSGKRRLHLFSLQKAFLNARMHAQSLNLDQDVAIYQALPLAHVFGLITCLFTPALLGSSVIFQTQPLGWALEPKHDLRRKPLLHVVPAQLKTVKSSWWADKSTTVTVGSDRAPKAMLDPLSLLCPNLFVTYGLTEAGPRVASGQWDVDKPEGWVGNFFPEIDYRFHKSAEEDIRTLQIKTPSFALTAELTAEGYLDTRDLMEPYGDRGGVFRARKGDRFKWRGNLYSGDMIREVAERVGLEQKATLFVIEDRKLAVVSGELLSELWKTVFEILNLPYPEHYFSSEAAFAAAGKLDAVATLKAAGMSNESLKVIYF